MASISNSFKAPFNELFLDDNGMISNAWQWFFREVQSRLYAFGKENVMILENGASATDITNAKFDKSGVTAVFFEYLCQRVTTGGSAVELTEVGILMFVYNPTSATWSKVTVSEANPDDAGLTITINSSGQLKYATSTITGTALISSLWWRARTLSGKNINYSTANR